MRRWIVSLLLCLAVTVPAQARAPLVLAAASLQESLNAAADAWAARGHERPVLSFAASSALARQVEAGAAADMFLSADEEWMDYVQAKGALRPRTRSDLLANSLVLIAPADSRLRFSLHRNAPLDRALGNGRLAMADPAAVPAGKYGQAALTKLGIWSRVEGKVARAENVRAALALVERGQAPLGIVYATDARASAKVRVIATFPANSHPPIRYPMALLRTAQSPDAEPFRRFLISRAGKAIFARYGFRPL